MAEVKPEVMYDHPMFTVIHQNSMKSVQGLAEDTNFALFRSRNKCIVTHCIVTCMSLPSAGTTFSLMVVRNAATTIATVTVTGFSVLGDDLSAKIITLTTLNTLLTASETMAIRLDTVDKGKWDVVWEYRLLF